MKQYWILCFSKRTGKKYWFNTKTGESTYTNLNLENNMFERAKETIKMWKNGPFTWFRLFKEINYNSFTPNDKDELRTLIWKKTKEAFEAFEVLYSE
jgi:hypothetical protein